MNYLLREEEKMWSKKQIYLKSLKFKIFTLDNEY